MLSTRVSQQAPVAPTAPTSEPMAAEGVAECAVCGATTACAAGLTCDSADGRCKKSDGTTKCWVGSTACTITATSLCVASGTITCSPDCQTVCGKVAETISSCTDSCGVVKSKSCPATIACGQDISIVKKAYRNETGNTSGNYSLSTEINTVARNQVFVYAMVIKNNGALTATNIKVSDTLDGENQDHLTFMDAQSGCSYISATNAVTCSGISLAAGAEITKAFRVKVSNIAVNGEVIKNISVMTVAGTSSVADVVVNATVNVTVSTVVACNNTCTRDSECATGLACDGNSNKCRKSTCSSESDCVCAVITAAPTEAPTVAPTAAPTQVVGEIGITEAPIQVVEPEALPETGILDFPGVAAFGGGLLLAVVGILLAL